MEKAPQFIKILPQKHEIKAITEHNIEAEFIFKHAIDSLQKFTEESSSSACLKESKYLIESLVDRMWEIINTGHFSQVSVNIRKIYSLANYFKVIISLICYPDESTTFDVCIEHLDKAILIGCTDDLYEKNDEFKETLNEYLTEVLGLEIDTNLLHIQKLKYEIFPCDIPVLECPSVEYFNTNFLFKQQPVVLRNIIDHWPALEKWRDINYLMRLAGNRTVPVEIGTNYTDGNWSQELIKIKDFLKRNFSKPCYQSDTTEYLAQHELFDQIPKLKDDIRIPDYCLSVTNPNATLDESVDIKAWLGPAGTISPMHHDPKNNILCQVFGRKKIILASAEDSVNLYPHKSELLNNTSALDVENIDLTEFPLAKNVKFLNLMLQEGDCLYIPPKWWHFVRSLNRSFSVSFWWE